MPTEIVGSNRGLEFQKAATSVLTSSQSRPMVCHANAMQSKIVSCARRARVVRSKRGRGRMRERHKGIHKPDAAKRGALAFGAERPDRATGGDVRVDHIGIMQRQRPARATG